MRHWVSHLPSYPPSAAEAWGIALTGPLCPVCGTLQPCTPDGPGRPAYAVIAPLPLRQRVPSRLRQSTDVS